MLITTFDEEEHDTFALTDNDAAAAGVRGSDVLEKEVRPIDASRNSEAIHGREELILPSKMAGKGPNLIIYG